MVLDVQIGDVVKLRKTHPCGSDQWTVRRIGADIGLICQGCGRHIMLSRRKFNKSVKKLVSRADNVPLPENDPSSDAMLRQTLRDQF